jgi:hypothetical protein
MGRVAGGVAYGDGEVDGTASAEDANDEITQAMTLGRMPVQI